MFLSLARKTSRVGIFTDMVHDSQFNGGDHGCRIGMRTIDDNRILFYFGDNLPDEVDSVLAAFKVQVDQ